MKVTIQLICENLSKEELAALLQAIRDCEQQHFAAKDLMVLVDAPELTTDEMIQLVGSIKPPFVFRKILGRG